MNRCRSRPQPCPRALPGGASLLLPGNKPFWEQMKAQLEAEHQPSWDELDAIETIWRRVIPEALNPGAGGLPDG